MFAVKDDAAYLDSQSGSGTGDAGETGKRWADQEAYYIYRIDFTKEVSSIKLELVVRGILSESAATMPQG